jgi:hypothetical protein
LRAERAGAWTGAGAGREAGAAALGCGDIDWLAAPPEGCAPGIWLAMPPLEAAGAACHPPLEGAAAGRPVLELAEPGGGAVRPTCPGGGVVECQPPVAGVPGAALAPPGVTACHPGLEEGSAG